MADSDRDAYLSGLTPGARIDHRGTPFTHSLLDALLEALRDPATGHPRLGSARFEWATFHDDARFESTTFEGNARFEAVTFHRGAWFRSARFRLVTGFHSASFHGGASFEAAAFERDVWFSGATFHRDAGFGSATFLHSAGYGSAIFHGYAWFSSATFHGVAGFDSATFHGDAWLTEATFQRVASFEAATFHRATRFDSASFQRDVSFDSAVFTHTITLGPFVCAAQVQLSQAEFRAPATLLLAAHRLDAQRTRWLSTAELRLRYTEVDLSHAVFEYPLTLAAELVPFTLPTGRRMQEEHLAATPDCGVRLATLRGVDAAHLVLADVDLSRCLFTGTVHLDQLRLEGNCDFATVPPAVHWQSWRPIRFTQRRTLAEEHHWRASQAGAAPGWNAAVAGAGPVSPLHLAPVYRALRKAFEDGKHEPGAADFYYGEMEMRRHAGDAPRSERSLLTAYWALSGYGMRASRALAWLGATMLVTIVLLMGLGLPQATPKQEAVGTVPAGGGKVTFKIDKEDPQNPTGNRFTGDRFERALNVTLNSVVFRSSGQDLTTAGTYIEMTSRLAEPVLLGLAVLAVRSRVKR
ncbi:pentapeptide repeat-containing protein (plasmid) [Streptomyces sp. HUAS 31]|uniref:pentapeptide repeat-containing protein n=1 Tax=Streptomyces TaxID=1883 RepID=UPI002306BECC|nr:pentapeptide repeat-containing protein [Streptomyces sp. HUAS 31]WCE02380.1 pentapeptide repeat-containing protein [Streptomyces sp. HUAS 31]